MLITRPVFLYAELRLALWGAECVVDWPRSRKTQVRETQPWTWRKEGEVENGKSSQVNAEVLSSTRASLNAPSAISPGSET